MKTKVAVVLWVLGVLVAMLGSSAIDAWNKRREQAQQINSILEEMLKNTCLNPACTCNKCDCGSDCECNLIQQVEDQLNPQVEPTPIVAKPKLIMHSIPGCGPCEQDKALAVQWLDTWDVEILTDIPQRGVCYPWYEVQEIDGTRFQFKERLSAQTVERHRNAVRTNRR